MAGGRGQRRMGSRRRREGEKKGVKNVGAEETGGKNRTVSTEATGICVERDKREEDRTARAEGVKREESVSSGRTEEG